MGSQFCYWDSKSLQDTFILCVLLSIQFSIGSIALVRLVKTKKYGQHGRSILVIYILIVIWSFVLCSQSIYSIVIFFGYLSNDLHQSVDNYSRIYVRFDIIPGFVVQTIFLQICRFYYQGLMNNIEVKNISKWQQKFIRILNFYFIIRIGDQFIGIILLNIFALTKLVSLFSKLNLWILIADSIIVNIFLMVSLRIYLRRFNLIQALKRDDIISLKKEYSLMILTSLMRVIIDIVFLAMPSQGTDCIGPFVSHIPTTIFYTLIGNIINHILPIACILKIYNIRSKDLGYRIPMGSSLIGSNK